MQTLFFYGSMVIVWVGFAIIVCFKPLNLANIIIGIASIAYSMVFDVTFGGYYGLYYYISERSSLLYITLAAIFIYSFLNMAYTMFLPKKKLSIIIYTLIWIAGMLAFELASFWTKTIAITGWRIVPWSFVTYIITYTWTYTFYRYLIGKVTAI